MTTVARGTPSFKTVGENAAPKAGSRTGAPLLSKASTVHTEDVPATTGTVMAPHSILVSLPKVTRLTVTFCVAPMRRDLPNVSKPA